MRVSLQFRRPDEQPWLVAGAPLQVAAERLAVLARSAEAIDIATRVPLEKRTSLAGLDCRWAALPLLPPWPQPSALPCHCCEQPQHGARTLRHLLPMSLVGKPCRLGGKWRCSERLPSCEP